jgi:hypothetical protein
MHDSLLFSESLLCWVLANYGYGNDPARDDANAPKTVLTSGMVAWSAAAAAMLVVAGGFGLRAWAAAAVVLCGSLLARWLRRRIIRVRHLMDFEAGLCAAAALGLYLITQNGTSLALPDMGMQLSRGRWSVLCVAAALLVYMIRGGNYIVRGILKRAGGMPDASEPRFETPEGYAHGTMIGQIERIIVVLVVMGGNLQALAFFFAAKGLIRSKELEERARADYFLLGSLASFLVALAAGLILQQVIGHLWR